MGPYLSQAAGLKFFNEAEKNHMWQQFYGTMGGLSNQHKNLRLHVVSCQQEIGLFNDIYLA